MKILSTTLLTALLTLNSCGIIINREDESFQSKHKYIAGEELKNNIKEAGEDAICIIISPNCSQVDEFMPRVKESLILINKDEINTRLIINMINTKSNETLLDSIIVNKHQIDHNLEIIDFVKHPVKAFEFKGKYDSFLTDLCNECNDKSLGYPYYTYYNDGHYIGKSYYFDEGLYNELKK